MFNRVKNALYNAVNSLDTLAIDDNDPGNSNKKRTKFPYTRPSFLQFNTTDEVLVSADHVIRPIIVPRDISKIPWNVGYAEAVNAGKSQRNEDQASIQVVTLRRDSSTQHTLFTSEAHASSPKTSPEYNLFKSNAAQHADIKGSGDDQNGLDITAKSDDDEIPSPNTEFSTPPSTPNSDKKLFNSNSSEKTDIVVKSNSELKCTSSRCIPYVYFGIFDGHAGSGAAVVAASELHRVIQKKLMEVINFLIPLEEDKKVEYKAHGRNKSITFLFNLEKDIKTESLITGALESAFVEMDNMIADERFKYKITGGCTSLVALFIFGKLFVANAGDSRAVLCKDFQAIPMSFDFTPETERERIKYLAKIQTHLLGDNFTQLEFVRRPVRKDIGSKLLCRDSMMTGWFYKTVTVEDLKFPIVYGEGKRSRLLATIGVTRGFGDHDLKAQNSNVLIKPFLSPQPEVKVYDLMQNDLSINDVLIMGTDGLWDITSNDKAAEIVKKSLEHFTVDDRVKCQIRYTSAAQDLVMHSRGKLRDRNWITSNNSPATIDDISVFVIPLLPYKEEFELFQEENDWVKSLLKS